MLGISTWREDTNPHGGYLGIYSGGVSCLADSKIKQGEQAEHVRESRVESVVVGRVVVADVIQFRDCVRSRRQEMWGHHVEETHPA